MIANLKQLGNKNKGSLYPLRANGLGGSSATPLFSFLKIPAAALAKRANKQKGKKEGGLGGGIFALLRTPRRRRGWGGSVSAFPLLRGRQNRKIFFSLIEKIFGGARLKKCRENFSVLPVAVAKRRRAETLGGIQSAKSSGFCSKKVRISSKQYRHFTISSFWEDVASRQSRLAGALRAPKPHFATICHAPRGEKEMFWFWSWKFVWAKPKAKQSFANQSFFVSPLAKLGSDNFLIF